MSLDALLAAIQKGGLPFVTLAILFAGYKGIWVWGSQLKAAEQREAEWKAHYFRAASLVDRATDTALNVTTNQLIGR